MLIKFLTPLSLLILIACSAVVKNPTNLDLQFIQTNSPPKQEYKSQVNDQFNIKFFPERGDKSHHL